MSYILDALKKSEQERGHGNIPDVQTVHSSSLNYRREKRTYWPYILITAVILNLAAIIYFMSGKEKVSAEHEKIEATLGNKQKTEIKNEQTAAVTLAEESNHIETNKKADEVILADAAPVKTKPTATKNSVTNTNKITEYYDLPEPIKQQLPGIVISAHVYSSNPSQRSIVINNNFLEQGEYVLDDLVLHEITADGAVLNYHGTLINYGVVSGWQ